MHKLFLPLRLTSLLIFLVSLGYSTTLEAQESCASLERRLDQARGKSGGRVEYVTALQSKLAKSQRNLDRIVANLNRSNCMPRQKLFGGYSIDRGQCRSDQIKFIEAEKEYRAIASQLKVMRNDRQNFNSPEESILRKLASMGCEGFQFETRTVKTQTKGLFGTLFGTQTKTYTVVKERRHRYRTVCVRSCDGYFFPVREFASRANFSEDESACQTLCPEAEVKLYIQKVTNDDVFEGMRSLNGEDYANHENAFQYQKSLVDGCRCRNSIQSVAYFDPKDLIADISNARKIDAFEVNEYSIKGSGQEDANSAFLLESFYLSRLPIKRPIFEDQLLDRDHFAKFSLSRPGLIRTEFAKLTNSYVEPIPRIEEGADITSIWFDPLKEYPEFFKPNKAIQTAVLEDKLDDTNRVNESAEAITENMLSFSKNGNVTVEGKSIRTIGIPLPYDQ